MELRVDLSCRCIGPGTVEGYEPQEVRILVLVVSEFFLTWLSKNSLAAWVSAGMILVATLPVINDELQQYTFFYFFQGHINSNHP